MKLALAAVASFLLFAEGVTMAQPEILISPMPPVAGQSMRIKYTGKLPATIKLDWHPSGTPSSVTIPANPGYVDVEVPKTAKSLIATDESGEADPVATMIQS